MEAAFTNLNQIISKHWVSPIIHPNKLSIGAWIPDHNS
jgi:hypothetical protein